MKNFACGLSCCLALWLLCPAARAQPPLAAAPTTERRLEAAQAFKEGKALWAKEQRAEALAEFERAYQLAPEFAVLYYVGAVSLELEKWARARRAFELYLQLGASQLTENEAKEAREHLDEAMLHTATLTLTLNVPGADVQVDGAPVEPTTISNLVLETGEHVVRVSKPGFLPSEQVVKASNGENVHLVLPLTPIATDAAAEEPALAGPLQGAPLARAGALDRAVPRELTPTPLWVPWTITGALATGWVTTAALAVKARHDRDIIERPGTPAERIDSARRLHITLAVVSDVLLATTLASAGVSAYLTWWSEPPTRSQAPRGAAPSNGLSLSVSGRF